MAEILKAPSKLNNWGIGAAILVILDSGYLSWIKLTKSVEQCLPGLGDCATVNSSKYAEIYGIPVAYLGLIAYITILLLLVSKTPILIRHGINKYLLFGVTFAGFLFSVYLTFVQFWLIKAFCPYCLLSAFITTLLFILAIIMLSKEIHIVEE